MVQSAIALPEHLNLFERKIYKHIDFSFTGPQSGRLALMIQKNKSKLGIYIPTMRLNLTVPLTKGQFKALKIIKN